MLTSESTQSSSRSDQTSVRTAPSARAEERSNGRSQRHCIALLATRKRRVRAMSSAARPLRAPQGTAGCRGKRFWLLFVRLQKVTGPARPWSATVACAPLSLSNGPHPSPLPRCRRGDQTYFAFDNNFNAALIASFNGKSAAKSLQAAAASFSL